MPQNTEQYPYPVTPRRAFVDLAEAIRTVGRDEVHGYRRLLHAIADLHLDTEQRKAVLWAVMTLPANASEGHYASAVGMELVDQEKFDLARFVHHATSDSEADDDGEEGKWSYNHENPEAAMKITLEAGDETVAVQ